MQDNLYTPICSSTFGWLHNRLQGLTFGGHK